ncbi:hypothetical protein COCSUDRAFT_59960 [Coccomyxa subellipsoidea C-169]|uniref:Uncharacterized protein n=1 Tax=Coccomyxa subellipsoidea (strain C-169) TaxID=574566 RepID=I0YJT2_COCSC|nr:hypothetical protein COCSUDRAFT_59960 [Coccomyxa subellipsoidea C-169]EIE18651.1 hypothetical protein COCSUDRAFT_59960 [Coccomyxa subellipsoidea C-169]|eukprot:XP_005643195.1 hypothetical protein COCSUDRAFT_59960 [Coccomyxa subellipsoidea C-169]
MAANSAVGDPLKVHHDAASNHACTHLFLNSSANQPATNQPATNQPATNQPSTNQPPTDQPSTNYRTADNHSLSNKHSTCHYSSYNDHPS